MAHVLHLVHAQLVEAGGLLRNNECEFSVTEQFDQVTHSLSGLLAGFGFLLVDGLKPTSIFDCHGL